MAKYVLWSTIRQNPSTARKELVEMGIDPNELTKEIIAGNVIPVYEMPEQLDTSTEKQ